MSNTQRRTKFDLFLSWLAVMAWALLPFMLAVGVPLLDRFFPWHP